jgi:hypothetical protein
VTRTQTTAQVRFFPIASGTSRYDPGTRQLHREVAMGAMDKRKDKADLKQAGEKVKDAL